MMPLPIVWQRLVNSRGQTCPRCSTTEQSLQRAMGKLSAALGPLDIQPLLQIREIDEKTFKGAPGESNRIWIAGKPLEDWLGATVSNSRCCSACGESECRTVIADNETYEAIPEELIIRAALAAASQIPGRKPKNDNNRCSPGCCDS